MEPEFKESCGIFWDIENVPIPKAVSTRGFIETIRKNILVENGLKEKDFVCVCDTQKLPRNISEHLNLVGVTIIHINASSKNAADDKLKELMNKFVHIHGKGSVFY